MTQYLFVNSHNIMGGIVQAETLKTATQRFLSAWNEKYFLEWQYELLSFNKEKIIIYSEKRDASLIFFVVEINDVSTIFNVER